MLPPSYYEGGCACGVVVCCGNERERERLPSPNHSNCHGCDGGAGGLEEQGWGWRGRQGVVILLLWPPYTTTIIMIVVVVECWRYEERKREEGWKGYRTGSSVVPVFPSHYSIKVILVVLEGWEDTEGREGTRGKVIMVV